MDTKAYSFLFVLIRKFVLFGVDGYDGFDGFLVMMVNNTEMCYYLRNYSKYVIANSTRTYPLLSIQLFIRKIEISLKS